MYTVVSKPEAPNIEGHRSVQDKPAPQIIDHRQKNPTNKKKQQTYENIKQQRDDLLESELKYARRIKELEKEKDDLLKLYEPTYKENEQLKSHLMHGPGSQNIKRLKQEKKKLLSELEIVKGENAELNDRIKDLEKMFLSEKEYYLEKKWREAIEKGRKRREEKDALMSTQGPFPTSRKPKKRDLKTVNVNEFEEQDAHDLHIDTLEKETQILLNKIRRIKQNKGSIDYAYFIGKGAVTRNSSIARAINEKLDKDLEQFENRLNNLRKKTRQLKDNSSEETEIPEKKLKVKQTGTKYFRTRHTQTDPDAEQLPIENDIKSENAYIEQNKSKASNISRKGSKKVSVMIKSNTPGTHIVREPPRKYVDKRTETLSEEGNNEVYSNHCTRKREARNNSQSPDEIENFETPIAEHWRHLAIKLNEAEKFGGKMTHRDKVKGRVSVQSGSSRRHESLSYVPEKRTHIRPNSEKTVTTSATSQRTIDSSSISGELSVSLSNNVENVHEIEELDYEHSTDDNIEYEPDETKHRKAQRKTINFGEEIHYVQRPFSFQPMKDMRSNSVQMGRYANGFEPISRKRRTNNKVNNSNKIEEDRKSGQLNDNNISVKYNEGRHRGKLYDDNSHQRAYSGDSIMRNKFQLHSGFRSGRSRDAQLRSSLDDHRRSALYSSSDMQRNNTVRQRSSSQDDKVISRKVSAYDEVLADVEKQYNDHARLKMINSTAPTENRYTFETEQEGVTNRHMKSSRENIHNLDLL